MRVKRRDLIAEFSARDSLGNDYSVLVFQDVIDAGNLQNPNSEVPGMKSLQMADGRHVNRLGKGKYQIVEDAIDLTSDDPDAF